MGEIAGRNWSQHSVWTLRIYNKKNLILTQDGFSLNQKT